MNGSIQFNQSLDCGCQVRKFANEAIEVAKGEKKPT